MQEGALKSAREEGTKLQEQISKAEEAKAAAEKVGTVCVGVWGALGGFSFEWMGQTALWAPVCCS